MSLGRVHIPPPKNKNAASNYAKDYPEVGLSPSWSLGEQNQLEASGNVAKRLPLQGTGYLSMESRPCSDSLLGGEGAATTRMRCCELTNDYHMN